MRFTRTEDSRSKITHQLLLVRRYPLDDTEAAALSGRTSFILRGYDPHSISCTGSLLDGIRLFGRKSSSSYPFSTDVKYATITRSAREIVIEVETLLVLPSLLPPVQADGSTENECTICCERMKWSRNSQPAVIRSTRIAFNPGCLLGRIHVQTADAVSAHDKRLLSTLIYIFLFPAISSGRV